VSDVIEHKCKTCRYWDFHSQDLELGDCRAPMDHRYWRVPMSDGTHAMMDSFEGATTKPGYSCDAWRYGDESEVLDLRQ
jgi:hypothetical protein